MPETSTTTSANGAWLLRYTNDFVSNAAGYGNGAWRFELVERNTGRVARSWSGRAAVSPWNEASTGTRQVSWDGDTLVIVDDDGTEERIAPGAP